MIPAAELFVKAEDMLVEVLGRIAEPLVAARDVEEPEFGRRLSWYADRALEEAGDLVGAIVPGL